MIHEGYENQIYLKLVFKRKKSQFLAYSRTVVMSHFCEDESEFNVTSYLTFYLTQKH